MWADLEWLINFRNDIAHAKPELVSFDSKMTQAEFERMKFDYPKSALELSIELKNAKRALKIAESYFDLLCGKMPFEKLDGLLSDSFSGKVSD